LRLLESYFHSVHRWEAGFPGSLRKPHRPVEPIVIGYRQSSITQVDRPFHQVLGMGRPVEKREVGVAVQFGIPVSHARDYIEHTFDGKMEATPPRSSSGYLGTMSISKTIRLSGGSSESIEDAIRTVLARAAVTIRDIERFDVVNVGGKVDGAGAPTDFRVTLDIVFKVREAIQGE
jgi:flavin-binding protein dodecin